MSDRVEHAKAAGWRIECLGDQQEGLWNWVIWSPDNGYCIQTEYPLANEVEAWDYFYGFIVGLPEAPATQEPAPVSAADSHTYTLPVEAMGSERVVNRSYVADHVAAGDFASVWDIIEALQKQVAAAEAQSDMRARLLDAAANDYAKGYDAGLLDGYTGVDADWVARFEAKLAAATELAETNANLLANAQSEAHELRLQVIDLEGWQTEALNRGVILERFYAQVYGLTGVFAGSKGALKRNDVIRQLTEILRGFRIWSPTARASKAATALAASDGEAVANDSGYSELLDELSGRIKGLEREQDAVRTQLGNMLFNLKQQPDMKRVTDSLASIMDSVGWDKS